MNQDELLATVLAKWSELTSNNTLPTEDTLIFQRPGQILAYDAGFGAAIPYPSCDHRDGTANHGYVNLKASPEFINKVPELIRWPEYAAFIRTLNAPASPIESLGCDTGFLPPRDAPAHFTARIQSYTDMAFSDLKDAASPEHHLSLAVGILESCTGCYDRMGSVFVILQQLKHFHGIANPLCLMVVVENYGRSQEEARQLWSETLKEIGGYISSVSK